MSFPNSSGLNETHMFQTAKAEVNSFGFTPCVVSGGDGYKLTAVSRLKKLLAKLCGYIL